jgi:hypothetical protein
MDRDAAATPVGRDTGPPTCLDAAAPATRGVLAPLHRRDRLVPRPPAAGDVADCGDLARPLSFGRCHSARRRRAGAGHPVDEPVVEHGAEAHCPRRRDGGHDRQCDVHGDHAEGDHLRDRALAHALAVQSRYSLPSGTLPHMTALFRLPFPAVGRS